MGDLESAVKEDEDDYINLCKKYNEDVRYEYGKIEWWGNHADSLKIRRYEEGKKMKDFNGSYVRAGDEVTFIEPYYKNLEHGKIIKINPKTITIKYMRMNGTKEFNHVVRFNNQFVLNTTVNRKVI